MKKLLLILLTSSISCGVAFAKISPKDQSIKNLVKSFNKDGKVVKVKKTKKFVFIDVRYSEDICMRNTYKVLDNGVVHDLEFTSACK